MRSDDDGVTFSEREEITASVRQMAFDWTRVATGPGHGIQMRSGRIIIPMWYMAGQLGNGPVEYRSGVIFSDDHGKTWTPGETVPPVFGDLDECEVLEAEDGSLCLNMRNESGTNRRAIAWSKDGGETWSDPKLDGTLIGPVCQASLMCYSQPTPDGKPIWLFSNPASKDRVNMTIRLSCDEGKTWPLAQVIHAGPSAYSCLAELPDGTIACLYECGTEHWREGLTFARFSLDWLHDKIDSVAQG